MAENIFINGLSVKKPSDKAPDFLKAKLSIKREDLIKTLTDSKDEWINLDLLESREGKYYLKVDTWKKEENKSGGLSADDLSVEDVPF